MSTSENSTFSSKLQERLTDLGTTSIDLQPGFGTALPALGIHELNTDLFEALKRIDDPNIDRTSAFQGRMIQALVLLGHTGVVALTSHQEASSYEPSDIDTHIGALLLTSSGTFPLGDPMRMISLQRQPMLLDKALMNEFAYSGAAAVTASEHADVDERHALLYYDGQQLNLSDLISDEGTTVILPTAA